MDRAPDTVLELLLAGPDRAAIAARAFDGRLGWGTAVELCSDWGVLPCLHGRLEELGIRLEGAPLETLQRRRRAVFFRSASCLHEGVRALAALADAGIDAAAIKGIAAIAMVYRGPADRSIGDADLLIRPADLEPAVAAFERAGLVFSGEQSLADHIRASRHDDAHDGSRAANFCAPDGSQIDLHWRLGRVSQDAILAGASQVQIYGRTIRVPNHVHGFLLSVYHAIRNGFVPGRASRELLDCAVWLDALVDRGETAEAARLADDWGLTVAVLAAVRTVAHFRPSGSIAELADAFARRISKPEQRQADDLTVLFLQSHPATRSNDDLVFFLYPELILRSAKRITTGRSEYRWMMRTDPALRRGAPPLGQRLRSLGRALRHADWQRLRSLKEVCGRAFR